MNTSNLSRPLIPDGGEDFLLRTISGKVKRLRFDNDHVVITNLVNKVRYRYHLSKVIRWGATADGFAMMCEKKRFLRTKVKQHFFFTREGQMISDAIMEGILAFMDREGMVPA